MKKISLGLFCCCVLISTQNFSQTTWTGSVSSDWNTAANWNPATVPGESTHVQFNNASAAHQPMLTGNTAVGRLELTHGILNLNGFTLTSSENVYLTGDSLYNGTIEANEFPYNANIHMGGKIVLNKQGVGGGFWEGGNRFHGDSLILIWRKGTLTLQANGAAPDSIYGNFEVRMLENGTINFAANSPLYVSNNLILDNPGYGTFSFNNASSTIVGGNFVGQNFAGSTGDFFMKNVTCLGAGANGPFYCHNSGLDNCYFNGNLTLIADSTAFVTVINSSLLGADNLLQAATFNLLNSKFGRTGPGTTVVRAANKFTGNVYLTDGNCKYFGNVTWDTYQPYPGNLIIQQASSGGDTCLQNWTFVLKGNTSLTANTKGNNYVAGDVLIDGSGARKWISFYTGENPFKIGGNLSFVNFTPNSETGVGNTQLQLNNVNVMGTGTVGTAYCTTGWVMNTVLHGDFNLIADSSEFFSVFNSSLLGATNLLQAGNLDVQKTQLGQTGMGGTTIRSASNRGGTVYMRTGGDKFYGDTYLQTFTTGIGAIDFQQGYGAADTVLGNLVMDIAGESYVDLLSNGLYLGKGITFQNNSAGNITQQEGTAGMNFIGSDTATFAKTGTGPAPTFIKVVMNRRGGLRLLSALTFRDYLVMNRGIILSSASNPLTVPAAGSVTGAWDSSYVDGPVKKVGNTAFTFPLGSNNVYAPLSITAPASITDAFTAQYFNHMPHIDGYDTTQHDVSLNHLSRKEYWTLTRTTGSSNVNVILSWETLRSGSVTNLSELRVAHWNGTTWKDEGNGGTTGNTGEGTIQSLNAISSFSAFTLASTGPTNPLPVRFVSFDARLNVNRTVLVQWTTTSEVNNDHFEIERSVDLVNWTRLQLVSNSLSHSYTYMDINPAQGYNYYRIKQVDVNGNSLYTETRTVLLDVITEIVLRPNPVINYLDIVLPFSKGIVEIAGESGAVMMRRNINASHVVIPVNQLKAGTYFARITSGEKVYVKKFVKM